MKNQSQRWMYSGMSAVAAVGLFLVMREVFAGRWLINPIALSIGSLEIHWYGIIIAVGILLTLEWTMRRAKARELDLVLVERAAFVAIVGGIVGARLVYVAQNLGYFTEHAGRIVALTDGGLSIHGALIGGALALYLALVMSRPKIPLNPPFAKGEVTPFFQKEPVLGLIQEGSGRISSVGETFARIADAAIPGLLLAMILGRLGNFANAELFGPPTDLPWKLFIPEVNRPVGLTDRAYYHPTFLYDILINTALLFALLWLERRWVAPGSPSRWRLRLLEGGGSAPGMLTLWFFLGIAITRFVVEFWRLGDSTALGLSLAQLVSLLMLAICLLILHRQRRSML